MRTGRPKAEVTLTAEERRMIEEWTSRPKTTQALAHPCPVCCGLCHGQDQARCGC